MVDAKDPRSLCLRVHPARIRGVPDRHHARAKHPDLAHTPSRFLPPFQSSCIIHRGNTMPSEEPQIDLAGALVPNEPAKGEGIAEAKAVSPDAGRQFPLWLL